MTSFLIWVPLMVASIFLLITLAKLNSKASKLDRQLNRLDKLRTDFESIPRTVTLKAMAETIPNLDGALKARRDYKQERTKKREAKQRRLISRLKSRS